MRAPRFGVVAAILVLGLCAAYAIVLLVGLATLPTRVSPIGDPAFSILELLILLVAPANVGLFAAIHATAAPDDRIFSLVGFAFATITAAITCSVHIAVLTIGELHASAYVWPSVAYAVDILAWDLFFGLALLFAARAFRGAPRTVLRISGALALVGLAGIPLANMQVRLVGVVGYAVVYPIAVLLVGLQWRARPS